MDNKTLKIITYNACSVLNQKQILSDFIHKHKPDILALQETFLKDKKHTYKIPNYSIYRNDRKSSTGGGTAILVKNTLKHTELITDIEDKTSIYIFHKKTKIKVTSLYISPTKQLSPSDWDELTCSTNKEITVGDFNAKNTKWGCRASNTRGKQLCKSITESSNAKIISPFEITRNAPDARASDILDIAIVANIDNNIQARVLEEIHSDHMPVEFLLELKTDNNTPREFLKQINWSNFRKDLNNHEILPQTHNTQTLELHANIINKQIIDAAEKNKEQTHSYIYKHKELSPHIKNLIREKRTAQRIYRETKLTQYKTHYNKINKLIHKEILALSKERWNEFVKKTLDKAEDKTDTNNSKFLYKIPNILKNRTTKRTIPSLQSDDKHADTDAEKAELLSDLYEMLFKPNKISTDIIQNITTDEQNIENWQTANNLKLITIPELNKNIRMLKNNSAPGPDGVSNKMLKNLPTKTKISILNLFNSSINSNHFPTLYKHSTIVPVHKPNKKRKDPNSYRPINLLPVLGKVLERSILNQLKTQISTDDRQFAYKNNHSTTQQLFTLTNHITTAFNKRQKTAAMFLDLSNAFDKVPHNALLHKLKRNGIEKDTYLLIKNYLTNRTFQVRVNGHYSTTRCVKAGVPQGSVLGPTLYSAYIHDLPQPEHSQVALFADDTALYVSSADTTLACNKLIKDTLEVMKYYIQHGMTVNTNKTKAMIFHRNNGNTNPPTVKINSQIIPFETSHKYLGTILDKTLSFRENIKHRIKNSIIAFSSLYHFLKSSSTNIDTRLRIYNAYVRPHLTYDTQIWCTAKQHIQEKIVSKFNKHIRTICEHKQNDGFTNIQIRTNHNVKDIVTFMNKIKSNFYCKLTEHDNPTLQQALQLGTIQNQDFPTQLRVLHETNNEYLGLTD